MSENYQSSSRNIIHLAVISDDGYAVPTAVMLTSAKHNKKATNQYVVHCLCNNMSHFAKRKIMELDSHDFRILIQNCEADKYAGIELPPGITNSTMIKCDLPSLLPDTDKVLFLDGDLLVKKDLSELWETNLDEKMVAAVNDMVGMVDLKLDELIQVKNYFNAGVMLLNLKFMREKNLGEKIIETKMTAPSTWTLGEQDPFNKVGEGLLVPLPPKWNMTAMLLINNGHDIHNINQFYKTNYLNYTEMEDDAGIIHFCTYKPWRNRLMPYAMFWQKYHNISPYGDTNLEHIPNYPVILKRTSGHFNLFGIPLLCIYDTELRTDCKLFGILRLFKIKKRDNIRKLYLFGVLPICSYTWKATEVK